MGYSTEPNHTEIPQLGIALHDFNRIEHDYSQGGGEKVVHRLDGRADTVTPMEWTPFGTEYIAGSGVRMDNDTDWPLSGAGRYFAPGTITQARQLLNLHTKPFVDYLDVIAEDCSWNNPALSGRAMTAVQYAVEAGLPIEAVPEKVRHLAHVGAEAFTRQALQHAEEGKGYLAQQELTTAYHTIQDLNEDFAFEGNGWEVADLPDASLQMQNSLTRGIWGRANTRKERERAEQAAWIAKSMDRELEKDIAVNKQVAVNPDVPTESPVANKLIIQ